MLLKPYKHQTTALELSKDREGFALFMEMGTGKSKVAIDNFSYLYKAGKIDRVVITAPKGTYMNWIKNEIPKHMPEGIEYKIAKWSAALRKAERIQLEKILVPCDELRIFIINIEAFSTGRGPAFTKLFLSSGIGLDAMMIVDESTTIKNHRANRTKNMLSISKLVKYKRILTGEPVTRSPLDLYTQCQFLSPTLLGFSSYYAFRHRYAIMSDMYLGTRHFKHVSGYQRVEELSALVKTFSYRIKKDECLDLPDKIYQYRKIEPTQEQRKIYQQVAEESMAKLAGQTLTISCVLVELLRLHQISCGHFKTDDGNILEIKNNRLQELMAVLDEAPDKVIIWANYIFDIKQITDEISKKYGKDSFVEYRGAVSDEDRQLGIERFQTDDKCRFFVGTQQTGGFGITLTAASTVIYYSNNYNLEHRLQSEDRAHRIGQTKNVLYVDIVCEGTIDERIVHALRAKKQIASMILGEKWRDWLSPIK